MTQSNAFSLQISISSSLGQLAMANFELILLADGYNCDDRSHSSGQNMAHQ
jgi:hypothetical protein